MKTHTNLQENVKDLTSPTNLLQIVFIAVILIALYIISIVNYLLFHGIVELAGIAVALSIFIIVWNTRRVISDGFFLIIGISFLFFGSIDLIHTLAFKGMGVLPLDSTDIPTQLWIAARYFQSITFLIATLFIGRSITKDRKYDVGIIIAACTAACALLFASIFVWQNFPACFIEGSGLTPFKIVSEYIISLIFIATIIILYRKREHFDPMVWKFLVAAQVFLILGELAFTSYISVFGFMNMLGHLFRLLSVYLFYRAFVVISLTRPYDLLLRELKQNENRLQVSEKKYRTLFESMLEGFAYCRIIYNDEGNPVDWVYLDVNAAFERQTGLKNIIGKRVSEAIPNIRELTPELFKTYERVASTGKPETFEIDFKPLNKWLKVSVFSPEREHFVAVFDDISERKGAEFELLRLAAIVEFSNDAIIGKTLEGVIFSWNAGAEHLYGYSPEEAVGKPISIITPPAEHDETLAILERIRSGEHISHLETKRKAKNGRIIDVLLTISPIKNKDGQVLGASSIAHDITGRKKAEETLRESEKRYHDMFELNNAVMLIVDPETGRIIDANSAASRYYGYSQEEFAQLMISAINIADPATTKKNLTKASEESGAVFNFQHRKKNGEIRDVEVFSAPIIAGGHRLLHSIIQDVTERRRMDAVLQENERTLLINEERLTMAQVLGHVGSWEYDIRTNMIWGSAEGFRIFGYPGKAGDFPIKDIETCIIERERIHQALVDLITKGLEYNVEYSINPADGSASKIIHSVAQIKKDADGNPLKVIGVMQDISEQKRIEEALRLVNKKLNLLSSITRHDINNQLFSLKAFLELSKESLGDAAKTAEYIIKEERAATAIERQIIFTKEYQDLGVKSPVWQDVEENVQKVQTVLPMRDVRVFAEVRAIEVYVDPLFEKVFYNLIDNALRYGGQKMTTIRIASQVMEYGLAISVEDDGAGISAEEKKRLFERGFGHNTGLGLFLSREILSITGISITETGEPGKGARFEILVPKEGYRSHT